MMHDLSLLFSSDMRGSREDDRGPDSPHEKLQEAIGFLRNNGTDDLPKKQLDPRGPIAFRGGP